MCVSLSLSLAQREMAIVVNIFLRSLLPQKKTGKVQDGSKWNTRFCCCRFDSFEHQITKNMILWLYMCTEWIYVFKIVSGEICNDRQRYIFSHQISVICLLKRNSGTAFTSKCVIYGLCLVNFCTMLLVVMLYDVNFVCWRQWEIFLWIFLLEVVMWFIVVVSTSVFQVICSN